MNKFFHWIGHVVFHMDYSVHINNRTQRITCKRCGRDVTEGN